MKKDSIFQTEVYLNSFDIKASRFLYEGNQYIYTLKDKTMYVLSTCVRNIYLTQGLATYIFETFPDISKIIFRKTYDGEFSAKYAMCEGELDDHILDLRETTDIEDYLSHLGKKTRQHLRYYKRNFNSLCETAGNVFESKLLIPHKITEEFEDVCAKIYELNNDRCLSKGFASGTDKRLINVCAACGGVIYYLLNGSVIAGTMFSIYEDNLYLHIVAHDNMYSDYNIGNLVLLDTIEYAIAHGLSEFHFLWGECEYKKRFGAKKYDLFDIAVYRSGLQYLIRKMMLGMAKSAKHIRISVVSVLDRIGLVKFIKNTLINIFGKSFVDKIGKWIYAQK